MKAIRICPQNSQRCDRDRSPYRYCAQSGIETANLLWREAYRFLCNVEALSKFEAQEDHERLRTIIHPLRWRTSSRLKDETICLSGCLDHTVEKLDKVESESERMKLSLGP